MPKAKTSLSELLHEIRRIEEHRTVLTENKIKKIYKSLMKDLNAFLGEAYTKYADKDGNLSLAILRQKAKYAWFVKEIDKTCSKYLPLTTKEIEEIVDKVYKKSYDGMTKAVKTASNEQLEELPVNQYALKRSMNNEVEKLTLPRLLEKHRAEITYEIQQVLNIGLMTGQRYESMTRDIERKLNFSYGKSNNIVRTETHRNVEAGFNDCAQEIAKGLEGSDLVYIKIYRNMGDERVRPQQRRRTSKGWKTSYSKNGANHMNMEGQVRKVDEPFEYSDGCKAMFPGSTSLPARHACRCRCFVEYDLMAREEFERIKQNGMKLT